MSDEAGFWDKRAEKYALRPIADQETYSEKLEITRTYFRNDSEVLEIGCGTGSTALAHAPYVKRILATDISPAMINIARDKAKAGQIDNISFETQAVAGHDIQESCYDVILANPPFNLKAWRAALLVEAHLFFAPPEPIVWPSDLQALMPISAGLA